MNKIPAARRGFLFWGCGQQYMQQQLFPLYAASPAQGPLHSPGGAGFTGLFAAIGQPLSSASVFGSQECSINTYSNFLYLVYFSVKNSNFNAKSVPVLVQATISVKKRIRPRFPPGFYNECGGSMPAASCVLNKKNPLPVSEEQRSFEFTANFNNILKFFTTGIDVIRYLKCITL